MIRIETINFMLLIIIIWIMIIAFVSVTPLLDRAEILLERGEYYGRIWAGRPYIYDENGTSIYNRSLFLENQKN